MIVKPTLLAVSRTLSKRLIRMIMDMSQLLISFSIFVMYILKILTSKKQKRIPQTKIVKPILLAALIGMIMDTS